MFHASHASSVHEYSCLKSCRYFYPFNIHFCVSLALLKVTFAHTISNDYDHQQPRARNEAPTAENIFESMSFDPPPTTISFRSDHPQPPIGVEQEGPLQTKLLRQFLRQRTGCRTWTHPYSAWWPKNNSSQGRGLSISHTDREDFTYGPGDPVESFEDTFFQAINWSPPKNWAMAQS